MSAKKKAPKKQKPKPKPQRKANPLAEALEKLVKRPLGPTLSGLIELDLRHDFFPGLCMPSKWSPELRKRREEEHGILILGEAAHGFFGPHRDRLGKTIDAGPIVYSDKQGLPAEIVGRNLGEFLSLWAYVPDFFTLRGETFDDLERLHEELFEDAELKKDVRGVLKLPGVKPIKSGRAAREVLNACLRIANDLWPDERVEELSLETTRKQLRAAEKARFAERFLTSGASEEEGQDFEVTRLRIRAIEAKALRKLVRHRLGEGASADAVDAEVAKTMDLSVEELRALPVKE